MKHSFLLFVGLVLLSFGKSATAQELSAQGYGKVRFGEKLAVVEARLKEKGTPSNREFACDFVQLKVYPGVRFMVEEGIVTRADIDPSIKNATGISVGASLASVKKRIPQIRIDPHKYDEQGHYLVLSTRDGKAAIVFEESEGRVEEVRAGLKPSVEYVEGCL